MLTMKLQLSLLSFIHLVFGYNYTSNDGVIVSYKIIHQKFCQSETGRFAIFQGLSVPECVKACGLRKHCLALQYRRRKWLCELFLSTENGDIEERDCVFITGSDITVHTSPCGECMYGSFCDTSLAKCAHHECHSAAIPENGKIEGNLNEENTKIKYTCNQGYREKNGVTDAVCLESGVWSTSAECITDLCDNPEITNGHVTRISPDTAMVLCDSGYESTGMTTIECTDPDSWGSISCSRIGCGSPHSVMHGHVVPDTVNGTFYLDSATVICDNLNRYSITCTSAGHWTTPTECIDCYPGTPWQYVGNTNVTKDGSPCQRWDSQQPHPHDNTDLQYFPETNLADANNYCRNPESGSHDPWCYTRDLGKEWEYCNVKQCQ